MCHGDNNSIYVTFLIKNKGTSIHFVRFTVNRWVKNMPIQENYNEIILVSGSFSSVLPTNYQ